MTEPLPTFLPGTTASLQALLSGDASVITVAIVDSAGDVLLAPTPYGISHAGPGLYLYAWAVPSTQPADTLSARWQATVGGQPQQSTEFFAVSSAGGLGTWCSVADVLNYTGKDVDEIDVTVAQQWIEGLIHRVWRPTDASRRDYYWLTRATAWQALYVHAHPELLTSMDVASISQDGLSITFKGSTQAVQIYSPVALRFLSSLFRGSNTSIRFNSAFQKNRLTKVGVTAGSSVPWNNL